MRSIFLHLLLLCVLFHNPSLAIDEDETLLTTAEKTNYAETGRYSEVEQLCKAFERRFTDKVRCFRFGISPQGRPIYALAASNDSTLTSELAQQRNRPIVLAQGGIHAGEIDGKDAGFRFLRDLLERKVLPGALDKVTFVFVPVFNVDGHERFGPWNRPNQNGPKEMGFRVTAQNLNLNRDYVKADAPEMRAMLSLLSQWDPAVYVDLHVTDGAQFQHDVAILVEPSRSYDDELQKIGRELQSNILKDLSARGSKPLDFYPNFIDNTDPSKGVAAYVTPPRFSQGYWGLRGRFGILVETHSWKDYKTRVQVTYNTLESVLSQTAKSGSKWLDQIHKTELSDAKLGGKTIPLSFKKADDIKWLDFLGYTYTRSRSAIMGDTVIQFDPTKPTIWRVPFYNQVTPAVSVVAPKGGYVIPKEWADAFEPKLKLHHVLFAKIVKDIATVPTFTFKISDVKWPSKSFEGRMPVILQGAWNASTSNIAQGSLFVPIAQPGARLVVALLEPQAPDSFAAWGDFNVVLEQKEYMEPYVAQSVAEEMLAKDQALKAEFEKRLNSDPKFAADPEARLDFFYQRHPSWDNHFRVYPILRVEKSL